MREAEFRTWLVSASYGDDTVSTQIARAKRLEEAYGDLDEHFDHDKFSSIRETLTYSAADKREGKPNPSKLEINGDFHSNLASHRATLNSYQHFRDDATAKRRPASMPFDNFTGIDDLKRIFQERMPDFKSFEEEEGQFWETEAAYKQQARKAVLSSLANDSLSNEECGREVFKALVQGSQQGLPLSWRTQGEISKSTPGIQKRFYETVAQLARLQPGDFDGLLLCARSLEALRAEGVDGLRRGEVLGITFSVYGTVNVNDACWFKARTFDRLGKRLLGKKIFASPQFEIADFQEFQSMLFRVRDQVSDWNWQPGSLTDIQGFIWVAMAETWDSQDVAGLTREAVESAMDECEEIGEAKFLAKYGFGRPRLYWVQREAEGSLYPAKAIVGAAHGFVPGGTPQRYNEFHSGSGDQETNGILKSLGFDIVNRKETGMEAEARPAVASQTVPTNLILYGPPGTGKTYATAAEAVRLCEGDAPTDRKELMATYQALFHKGRIGFVTFHQSISYEEFVEGLRPVTGADEGDDGSSGGFSLKPHDGIFKQIAMIAAGNKGRTIAASGQLIDRSQKIFKMSLGRASAAEDDAIFQDAIDGGYVVLGWGGDVDWSDPRFDRWEAIKERWRQKDPNASGNDPNMSQMYTFRINMQIGSLVVISDGNRKFRAVGQITGPYTFVPGPNGEYNHRRSVRWLWHSNESLPRERIYGKELSQVSAYQMNSGYVDWDALEQVVASGGKAVATTGNPEPYVLIIDEINRANVSKVFGELITLIEPDKRIGTPNELRVKLPYSGDLFGVPANLHIVGTMNTADRSIALLDTALRRRFQFKELLPDPTRIDERVEGISLRTLLTRLNERIEYLFDRDHQIGHAYFIGCSSRQDLDDVMRHKVIPLLAEYFYEDWSKVAAVLGDSRAERFLERRALTPPDGLDIDNDAPPRWRWSVRDPFAADAYAAFT